MKLYYSPGACSLGPHIVLRETGEPVELVQISVNDGETNSPEFLAINPRGRVPVLEVDGQIYGEGPALVAYLASRKPEAALLPPLGSVDLARSLEWTNWFSSSLHIAYAQLWRPERFLPAGAETAAFVAEGKRHIERLSSEVNQRIVGPWLLGERYSIADCYGLAFFRWGYRIGLEMHRAYPRWSAWAGRMIDRPAVREAIAAEGLPLEQFYLASPALPIPAK